MKTSTIIWTIVGILIVAIAWFWFTTQTAAQDYSEGQTKANAAQEYRSEVEPIPLLRVATTTGVGPHLVARNGMTVYRTDKDSRNKSNCAGACVLAWPPYVLTSSQTLIGGGGAAGKVGTMKRRDGSIQVTYEGAPLYFWKKDVKPGEARGEGMGKWHVVRP